MRRVSVHLYCLHFFLKSASTFALTLVWWRQMFPARAIDLSICRPVCQKWDVSIKCCDETVNGPLRQKWNSSSAPVLRLRARRSSLARFIAPYLPPEPLLLQPASSSVLRWLPYFFLSFFFFISRCLYRFLVCIIPSLSHFPRFIRSAWFPPFLLPLSLSPWSFLIDISLTLSSPACLSLSFSLWQLLSVCLLPVSLPAWGDRPYRRAFCLPLPFCPQGKQLWWGLMHYWSLSPLRIYLLMHTWAHSGAHTRTHTHTDPIDPTSPPQ